MPRLKIISYPSLIDSKYIKTHWDFEDDLKNILDRSGSREDFSGKYKQRLKYLEESKEQCILRKAWFENLKQENVLYAMRFDRSQKNIRILFVFISSGNQKFAVLLHAFEEKEAKKLSKHGYDKAISVAQKRYEEVMKDG
jgi:hypothetical protein